MGDTPHKYIYNPYHGDGVLFGVEDADKAPDSKLRKGTNLNFAVYDDDRDPNKRMYHMREGDGSMIRTVIVHSSSDKIEVQTANGTLSPAGGLGMPTDTVTVESKEVACALRGALQRAMSNGDVSIHEAIQLERLRQTVAAAAGNDGKFNASEISAIITRANKIAPDAKAL